MPIDEAAPRGETPFDRNEVPWVSRCREREINLPQHPTHLTIREWTQALVTRTITASDRMDNWVTPWIMRAKTMSVDFEEPGNTPHAFVRLDRILLEAVLDCLNNKSELKR